MPVDVVERTGLEHALEVERLVGDQITERHTDTRQPRLVERDERVAERYEEQELGEAEYLLAEPVVREHHPDALPADADRRARQEERVTEPEELRLVHRQQVRDRLLDGRQEVQ